MLRIRENICMKSLTLFWKGHKFSLFSGDGVLSGVLSIIAHKQTYLSWLEQMLSWEIAFKMPWSQILSTDPRSTTRGPWTSGFRPEQGRAQEPRMMDTSGVLSVAWALCGLITTKFWQWFISQSKARLSFSIPLGTWFGLGLGMS